MFKPRSFLLYVLAILATFFAGLFVAGLLEAGKHQGLAGGAIVLGYGVVAAGIGLIASLLIAWKANRNTVVRLNGILAILILASFVYFQIKYREQKENQIPESESIERPTSPSAEPIQPNSRLTF